MLARSKRLAKVSVCAVIVAFLQNACSRETDNAITSINSTSDTNTAAEISNKDRKDLPSDPHIIERGRRLFSNCGVCHSVNASLPSSAGPHLQGVLGRTVGSVQGFPYTSVLMQQNGVWSVARLDQFIKNPRELYPGTSMAFGGIADESDRRAIIAYLASLDTD